jgi:arginine decarboxylase
MGLEVGSKAELFVALGLIASRDTLIVCNGFKDEAFLRLILLAQKVGQNVICVAESMAEVQLVVKLAKRMKIRPTLGLRAMLYSKGSGRWEKSSGPASKFGLTTREILQIVDLCRREGFLDCIEMVHFHVGSQVTQIRRIKNAIKEAARVYTKLKPLVPSLKYLNVGGGLGVDYDGSRSSAESSTNYTMQEYANDVVYTIGEICNGEDVDHPVIVSESGRAIAAYHSVVLFDVFREMRNGGGLQRLPPGEKDPPVIAELAGILDGLTEKNYREYFHDGIERREEMFNLFDLGYLSLEDRARGEELFWEICRKALRYGEKVKNTPEEFEGVRRQLASRFICNFSVFQTLPDAFSLDQLFPIMPIHRLREEPTVRAILGDITCDSDGVIDSFVDPVRSKEFLDLHPMDSGAYYVGVFLTGAYQDVMGDLHNMFGMTNEVHVVVGDEGSYTFHRVVQGDTVLDVLGYLRFDAEQLTGNFFARVNEAVGDGRIKRGAAAKIFEEWTKGIETYTYLNG